MVFAPIARIGNGNDIGKGVVAVITVDKERLYVVKRMASRTQDMSSFPSSSMSMNCPPDPKRHQPRLFTDFVEVLISVVSVQGGSPDAI